MLMSGSRRKSKEKFIPDNEVKTYSIERNQLGSQYVMSVINEKCFIKE